MIVRAVQVYSLSYQSYIKIDDVASLRYIYNLTIVRSPYASSLPVWAHELSEIIFIISIETKTYGLSHAYKC